MSDNVILAIIGLLSGIGLEFVRQLMSKRNTQQVKSVDDITSFRKELLEENHKLREDRDEWQKNFYKEREARQRAEWQLEALEWIRSENPTTPQPPRFGENEEEEEEDAAPAAP